MSGFAVDAMGWANFYWLTIAAGIPGMLLLARFVPPGVREPAFSIEPPRSRTPLGAAALVARGAVAAVVAAVATTVIVATLDALKAMRATAGAGFELGPPLATLLAPVGVGAWITLAGIAVVAAVIGLFAAAVAAARHGARDPEVG